MSASRAIRGRLRQLGSEEGIGLIELLIAMTVLSVGLLAVSSVFTATSLTTQRASRLTTAQTLAESRVESLRAVKFAQIGLDPTALAAVDGTYTGDSAYSAASPVPVTGSTFAPTASMTGADGLLYRVDSYINWRAVTGGRNLKKVTIVVRETGTTTKTLARIQTLIDEASV